MAKKTATYGGYELRVEDNGKIVILNAGQPVPNAMGAIRSIASEVGFTLDPKWNTQSSGRKLVDFINSSAKAATPVSNSEKPAPKASAHQPETKQPTIPTVEVKTTSVPQSAAKPEPAPTPKPKDTPANQENENELTEEEMEELLKQIAELRKTIERLESRITKLEKSRSANPDIKNQETNGKDYKKEEFKIDLRSYVRDEDGSITKFWKSAKKVNFDTHSDSCYNTLILSANGRVASTRNEAAQIWSLNGSYNDKTLLLLTEIADDQGHKFSFDVPDQLPKDGREQHAFLKNMKDELVKTFGKGGIAFFHNYMLEIDSDYILRVGSEVMDNIVSYLSNPNIIKREWDNEPFVDNLDWSDAERYEAIKKYVKSLKKRY